MARAMAHSLRRYLIAWITGPIAVFVLVDTVSLYRSAMQSIDIAYDRSLLASARSIGEQLQVVDGRLQVELPYTALEIFDVGGTGSMAYRITGVSRASSSPATATCRPIPASCRSAGATRP
jgi:two-component system, OmpR family, sensor histidine kinase TctE